MEDAAPRRKYITDFGEKSANEIARDKRVAEIAKAFKPVEIACTDL
jgi:hypothetical protein